MHQKPEGLSAIQYFPLCNLIPDCLLIAKRSEFTLNFNEKMQNNTNKTEKKNTFLIPYAF